jgi:hypothetical protein
MQGETLLRGDGTAWAWGSTADGQTGDGTGVFAAISVLCAWANVLQGCSVRHAPEDVLHSATTHVTSKRSI